LNVLRLTAAASLAACVTLAQAAPESRSWPTIVAAAKGQTVYWNAWGGDDRTNAFIAWAGGEVKRRYGITIEQVKLNDTAEAVARVVAEKGAGRDAGGSVDLIWINGPNFLAMKTQVLLYGPFTQVLPNYRYVDTVHKRSNLIDFTVPIDGLAAPWHLAQFVYIYDSARYSLAEIPKSAPALLEWARRHPGRVTHPTVRNFLGATFLKQALYDFVPDPSVLQSPATDATFAAVTAPLWRWYDQLRPSLWREGREFPESGPAQRQLAGDPVNTVVINCADTTSVAGTVSGLRPGTSVTLSDGYVLLPIASSGAFAFPELLTPGTTYNVTVTTPPVGETCAVTNGSGYGDSGQSMSTTNP